MPDKATLYCSFCGKSQHELRKLIAGPTVFICDECVVLCMSILDEEFKILPLKPGEAVPTPTYFRELLDREIHDQDHVKHVLSVVLHRHYRRLAETSKQASTASLPNNILLCGPSLGRSDIACGLMRCSGVPFVAVDAIKLIELHDPREVSQRIIGKLLNAAYYHREVAQSAIVYIDDLDRIGHLAGNPPGREEVQESLIGLMTGAVVDLPIKAHDRTVVHTVDTKTMTFICAGTSFGLPKPTGSRAPDAARGQDADDRGPDQLEGPLRLSEAEAEALVGFGLLPDLVSCLSACVALEDPELSD